MKSEKVEGEEELHELSPDEEIIIEEPIEEAQASKFWQKDLLRRFPELSEMLAGETLENILQLLGHENDQETIESELKDLLSGMPAEGMAVVIDKITSLYFGNERIRALLAEIQHQDGRVQLKTVLDILGLLATDYQVFLTSTVSQELLVKEVYFELAVVSKFEELLKNKKPAELTIEAEQGNDSIELYYKYFVAGQMEIASYELKLG